MVEIEVTYIQLNPSQLIETVQETQYHIIPKTKLSAIVIFGPSV